MLLINWYCHIGKLSAKWKTVDSLDHIESNNFTFNSHRTAPNNSNEFIPFQYSEPIRNPWQAWFIKSFVDLSATFVWAKGPSTKYALTLCLNNALGWWLGLQMALLLFVLHVNAIDIDWFHFPLLVFRKVILRWKKQRLKIEAFSIYLIYLPYGCYCIRIASLQLDVVITEKSLPMQNPLKWIAESRNGKEVQ